MTVQSFQVLLHFEAAYYVCYDRRNKSPFEHQPSTRKLPVCKKFPDLEGPTRYDVAWEQNKVEAIYSQYITN